MQGKDSSAILGEMNNFFLIEGLGVRALSFTIVSIEMPDDLVNMWNGQTGFRSQTLQLNAQQALKMQELDNVMELARLKEEATCERLGITEEGANKLAQIDIEITDITSQNSKECAALRAEYEEKVQELMNDAELEVVDLNNVRDRVSREVQARVAKEEVDIDADALMYARDKELEKVIESAKNLAKAKKAVADA